MTEEMVHTAKKLAEEFTSAAAALLRTDKESYETTGTKESGALRRKSMDLTRVLADMRRGPNG